MAAAVTIEFGPAPVNLKGLRAGDRNPMHVVINSKGTPYDLTGVTLSAQVRLKAYDTEPAVTAVITVDADPTTGGFTMEWPGDQIAAAMPASTASWSGVWDLQAQVAETAPTTIAAGSFQGVLDVTRP